MAVVLTPPEGNVCLAPHSLADALTMAGQGAHGPTRTEFEQLLGSLDGAAALARNKQLPLLSVNRLWVQRGFPIVPAYATYCQNYFGAKPAELDFIQNPGQAVGTINSWVKSETRDLIPKLLEPKAVTRDTRLVLTNATTLKAKWMFPFDSTQTRPQPFLADDGSKPEMPMMGVSAGFPLVQEAGLDILEMPYQESGLSLIVALPRPGGLAALEKQMDERTLGAWLDRLSTPREEFDQVHLTFPKMEVRSDQLALKQPLIGMGLKRAFSRESDFSGLSPQGDQLFIDDVVQATMIRFDEVGTEAAAATAVTFNVRSEPIELRVDHPFLFFLVHRPTATVLFSGRVVKP